MNEVKSDIVFPNWQAYVTTIKCDIIDEYVSLMVKNGLVIQMLMVSGI